MVHASALAGACAGLVSSIVTCPLDVVKTRLQAQGGLKQNQNQNHISHQPQPQFNPATGTTTNPTSTPAITHHQTARLGSLGITNGVGRATVSDAQAYNGLIGALKRIWRDDGFRGFYRGLGPTIFGYLPTWAIYFTVYDGCKGMLARDLHPEGEEDFLNHILSAMTAGAASTICTSPLWVVKTRFMLQSHKDPNVKPYRHTGDAFYQIFKTEGIRGFYKGLLPSLFGVSHVAVQFPLYEAFKSYAKSQRRDRLDPSSSQEEDPDDLPASIILACSSSAKMIASVMTYPHEVLRTRMQMQPRMVQVADASGSGSGSGSGNGNTKIRNSNGNHRNFSTSSTSTNQNQFNESLNHSRKTYRAIGSSTSSSLSPPPPPSSSSSFSSSSSTRIRTSSPLISNHWLPFRRRFSNSNPTKSNSTSHSASHSSSTQDRTSNPISPRKQGTYSGILKTCKTIATEEGIRGFYRGMGVNLIRTVPSSALTILTYEVMMSHLTSNDQDESLQDDTD